MAKEVIAMPFVRQMLTADGYAVSYAVIGLVLEPFARPTNEGSASSREVAGSPP
jgi:hypothetical protein